MSRLDVRQSQLRGVRLIRQASRRAVKQTGLALRLYKDAKLEQAASLQADKDVVYMNAALAMAQQAAEEGEVPIGAVVVWQDQIISKAHNAMERSGDPTQHAEMLAIQLAVKTFGRFKLPECTMYVTSEPCPMCGGALLQARVGTVVYGTKSPLIGSDGSWIQLLRAGQKEACLGIAGLGNPARPHAFHPDMQVRSGVLADECAQLLQSFFGLRRQEESRSVVT